MIEMRTRRLLLLASTAILLPGIAAAQQAPDSATGAAAPAGTTATTPAPDATPQDAAPALGNAPAPEPATPATEGQGNEIVVTATRRSTTVQNAPINIAAVGADQLEAQRLDDLRELVRAVPGIYIPDTGPRNGAPIVFRGLNADPLGSGDGNNSGGGTVATYVGEIPLYIDLRLNDIERVEFLAGPQGTLYGAGTLGGAVRYIPKRPQFSSFELETRGEAYGYDHSSGVSYNLGATINLPITPQLAFRASLDRTDDQGFIDQPYVVNQIGVSNPDPDFTNPADVKANTHKVKDVNDDRVWAGRAALRWEPTSTLDADLTWYHQTEKTNGRQASSHVVGDFPVAVGKWDDIKRVLEPNTRDNDLVSLEVTADLGFASLTSATGRSWFKDDGHRDQTDLLIGLEYSYEAFPDFTAYTTEKDHTNTFTQELRLVSKSSGPFSWIVGAFYNDQKSGGYSKEFTPGYSAYLVNVEGYPGPVRPDDNEYYSTATSRLKESAVYGEASYKITPEWQVTAGGRYYHYNLKSEQAVDLPLYETVTGTLDPTSFNLTYNPANQKKSGFLYKFNTSYQLARDVLAYATASQGYRIGNSNGIPLCSSDVGSQQSVCAQPNELAYNPDKTNNYELGVKSQWFDRRLTLNLAAYYIKWTDPQVASATKIGLQPITINGSGARSVGGEALIAARPTDRLSLRFTYAYTAPELTKTAPNLISYITGVNPDTGAPAFQSSQTYADGEPGDRLPGSPHHSGSAYVEYALPLGAGGKTLNFSYTLYGQSNVFTTTGARGLSYTLPGYTRSDVAVRLVSKAGDWSATLYCDNIFNSFDQTGVAGSAVDNQSRADADGGIHYVRTFYTYVQPPRQFGIRLVKTFR